jgi:Xaa-Pro aminopeptidase
MILSNEPGYYRDGCFGIRCENLLVVQAIEDSGYETPMMKFDALTMVPFDNRLLSVDLLTGPELSWINAYHSRVNKVLGPLLSGAEKAWMEQATRSLSA